MAIRQAVATDKAPKAIGPYSQGIRSGNLLFISGQVPIDPATGNIIEGDIKAQTDRVMRNLTAILEAAGGSMDNVLRCTVYLKDMNDFAAMNEVYGSYFSQPAPARSTIQAVRLPKDANVEIDVIATL